MDMKNIGKQFLGAQRYFFLNYMYFRGNLFNTHWINPYWPCRILQLLWVACRPPNSFLGPCLIDQSYETSLF